MLSKNDVAEEAAVVVVSKSAVHIVGRTEWILISTEDYVGRIGLTRRLTGRSLCDPFLEIVLV